MPESRDPRPARADLVGAALSTAGLVAFVYGVVGATARGWTDPQVAVPMAAGAALLTAFVVWETRTPDPLIHLGLFRRALFLWGSVVNVVAGFAMFGLLFTLPQYLQFVTGHDPLGTGLRLLPMIGGLMVGAPLGQRLTSAVGYRIPVSSGLAVMAVGLAAGAATDVGSGYGFVAGWLAVTGFGLGAAMAPATDALLGAVPAARSGAGVAVAYALRQSAGALGVAVLGTALARTYAERVAVYGVPGPARAPARESITGALAVADRLADAALAGSARAAFTEGMGFVLASCAAVTLVGAALTALYMPARPDRDDQTRTRASETTAA